jgi:dTDP-4-dehydrorhamnose reductase
MKILVTGGNGMLCNALVPALKKRGHSLHPLPHAELDITRYLEVTDVFSQVRPDLVIHPAAYTAVDKAESESDLAYLINGYGTENIAVACQSLSVPLLYVSTDYVFDGTGNRPYQPWDRTNPLSVYGKSKLAGELAIQQHLHQFYIVRTSWLYGIGGPNFVETMLRLASERDTVSVVADQHGTPTSTATLSEVIADLISTGRWGVYHATDGGVTNWHEFASTILSGKNVKVLPITTSDFPRPAPRPGYSVLDKTSLIKTIGRDLVPWQESLQQYLNLRLQKLPA